MSVAMEHQSFNVAEPASKQSVSGFLQIPEPET
jgi:hypothetical protein